MCESTFPHSLQNTCDFHMRSVLCVHQIKTHGHVSADKKVMWHTSVLFTGTTKLA